ncbi:zincin [Acaromyces ingoldii]|uniref:Zincin n=1 Tax=Acaromyces ingoldii TaxID=215250 RepID=A0A316YK83_9BASI|nr:zincin [Acaromyces ingoldii]PWN89837.1 zincin [Acaromyces ingoldii]
MADYGRRSGDDADESRPLLHGDDEVDDIDDRRGSLWHRIVAPLKHPESLRPLEKALLLLSLLLLLLFSVFVGLYAGTKSRLDHIGGGGRDGNDGKVPGSPGGATTCTSQRCVLAASDILHAIDETVDPCDDFYAFSTGGWLREHPIPGDSGLFGMAQKITSDNAQIIKDIVEVGDDEKKLHLSGNSEEDRIDARSQAKLRDFFQSCMDLDAQDRAGDGPLLDVIDELRERLVGKGDEPLFATLARQIDDTPVPPNQPPSRSPRPHPPTKSPGPLPPAAGGRQKRITEALAWAHARGLPAFFEWDVQGEPVKDPAFGTAYLGPSGLGFPDKAYYDDEDEIEFYQNVVEQSMLLLDEAERRHKHAGSSDKVGHSKAPKSSNGKAAKKLAKLVVELEKSIAKITPEAEDLEDPLATYNPTSLRQLSYLFESVDWPTYLSALSVRVPKSVIVQSPSFVKSLDSLLSRTKTPVIEAYLAWTALRTLGLYLGPSVPLRKPIDALDRRSKGVDEDAKVDREGYCLGRINEALGFMAGRFFVKEAFSQDARQQAQNIIEGIITAFKERLPELDWLDDKTRAKAQIKADAVTVKVGWPTSSPNTTDAADVDRFYSDLKVDRKDYLANSLSSLSREARRSWARVGRKIDKGVWDMFPAEVNAYYNPGNNEIVFPAGILQPMYFSEFWPAYLQYGVFGSVAGHELSHAFDPEGRLFDEQGRLHDWWTNDTAKAFEKRKDCIVDQYAGYTIPDTHGRPQHLRSKFTIGEDVADAGGLAQSFRAWRDHVASTSSEPASILPGLNYTQDQLFFIAYGIGWARNIRTQEAIRRLRTDPHSPTKYRVIGALSNDLNFREAFGCKAGDRMVRPDEERCSIW